MSDTPEAAATALMDYCTRYSEAITALAAADHGAIPAADLPVFEAGVAAGVSGAISALVAEGLFVSPQRIAAWYEKHQGQPPSVDVAQHAITRITGTTP